MGPARRGMFGRDLPLGAAAVRRHLRRPTRASLEFAGKAAVAATVAVWVGNRVGLKDTYWAAISAVVATAGTLGASVGAAVSRISATVVGLLVGLVAVALPVSGTLVDGVTVFVALVVLAALSLDAAARLGAATTLIVTAVPGENPVSAALARGANVPLGCAIAVGVRLLFFPRRAAAQLRVDLRADVQGAGEVAHSALLAYLGATGADDLQLRLDALVRTTAARAVAVRDAAREPGGHGERLLQIQRELDAVGVLLEDVASLVAVAREAGDDRVPALVRGELRDAAEAFAQATRAVVAPRDDGGFRNRLVRVNRALLAVDGAFARARARRATVEFSGLAERPGLRA